MQAEEEIPTYTPDRYGKILRNSPKPRAEDKTDQNSDGRQQLSEEQFLINELIPNQLPNEIFVNAHVIFKNLVHWNAFSNDEHLIRRVIYACKLAITKSNHSRTLTFHWLSTCLCMIYLAQKQLKSPSVEISAFNSFISEVTQLASLAFETLIDIFDKRLSPIVNTEAAGYLFLNEDEQSLQRFLQEINANFPITLLEHLVFATVKSQYFHRIFTLLTTQIIDSLMHFQPTENTGMRLKIVVATLDDWARSKFGTETGKIIEDELRPITQAANILQLNQKKSLLDPSVQREVCPNLRPTIIFNLLRNCPGTTGLDTDFTDLLQQDSNFTSTSKSLFSLNSKPPLSLSGDLEIISRTLDKVVIPIVVLDRFLWMRFSHTHTPPRQTKW